MPNQNYRLFQLSHIGEFHVNHNEDFLIAEEIGKTRLLIAVMDGCSNGTHTYFASTLIGKLLRKIAKQEAYREYVERKILTIEIQLKRVAHQLFHDLSNLNRQLDLKSDELLSTLIMAIIDIDKYCAEILISGDGIIHINGCNIEYDNDNRLDYLGYHLNMDYNTWFKTKTQKLVLHEIEDLTIATDGVYTFKNFDGRVYQEISEEGIMTEFFVNKNELENKNKLKKSLIFLKKTYGIIPYDDLTMIRWIRR